MEAADYIFQKEKQSMNKEIIEENERHSAGGTQPSLQRVACRDPGGVGGCEEGSVPGQSLR